MKGAWSEWLDGCLTEVIKNNNLNGVVRVRNLILLVYPLFEKSKYSNHIKLSNYQIGRSMSRLEYKSFRTKERFWVI